MRYLDIARRVGGGLADRLITPAGDTATAGDEACPLCGITPAEREMVRRRRELDDALRALDAHYTSCATCTTTGPWCEQGRQLRDRYFAAWLRWTAWY